MIEKKQRRVFSDDFKKKAVAQILAGEATVSQIAAAIGMRKTNPIYTWVKKYQPSGLIEKVVFENDSDYLKAKSYAKQIGELEKMVGQMHVKISLLEGIINESSTYYGEDIVKKFLKK
jgi:transposase-like protein